MKKCISLAVAIVMIVLSTATTAFAAKEPYYSPIGDVKHKVTYHLVHTNSSNLTSSVKDGDSYKSTVKPQKGYKITSVKITMGGKDITSSVYSNKKINVKKVTGDLYIEVISKKAGGQGDEGDDNNGGGSNDPNDSNDPNYNGGGNGSGGSGDDPNGNGSNGGNGSGSSTSPITGDNIIYFLGAALLFGAITVKAGKKVKK